MGAGRIWMAAAWFAFAPALAAAAAPAEVRGLQMPAWLERDGHRTPLSVGMALRASDRLHTGAGARVLLRLSEGSDVKLGENADLDLATLAPGTGRDGVFKGVLDVLKGAFRFTTSALGRSRHRDITARIATLTIGIRGTDVWGKAAPDRDFVLLIEGRIAIQRDREPARTMDTALTLFMAPKGRPARPIAPANPDDVRAWAQETELQPGGGVLTAGGAWTLYLASYRSGRGADPALRRLADAGYAAAREPAEVNGVRWIRLKLAGFASRQDALAQAGVLGRRFGFETPWVAAAAGAGKGAAP